MKQPEECINHLKENEAANTGNNDNAENVNSLQQTLKGKGRTLVHDFSEEEIEYISVKNYKDVMRFLKKKDLVKV